MIRFLETLDVGCRLFSLKSVNDIRILDEIEMVKPLTLPSLVKQVEEPILAAFCVLDVGGSLTPQQLLAGVLERLLSISLSLSLFWFT